MGKKGKKAASTKGKVCVCANCGRERSEEVFGVKKCSACKVVRYSSRECQRVNWKVHRVSYASRSTELARNVQDIKKTRFGRAQLRFCELMEASHKGDLNLMKSLIAEGTSTLHSMHSFPSSKAG